MAIKRRNRRQNGCDGEQRQDLQRLNAPAPKSEQNRVDFRLQFVVGVFESKATDQITRLIISASIEVHNAFGPGLREKIYVSPLVWALEDRGLKVRTHVPLEIAFRGRRLGHAYYLDLFVDETVVVEVKSVDTLLPVHIAQTITYVRLASAPAGLLINFNVKRLVDGVRRVVNDWPKRDPEKLISVASE